MGEKITKINLGYELNGYCISDVEQIIDEFKNEINNLQISLNILKDEKLELAVKCASLQSEIDALKEQLKLRSGNHNE
ncbi:hypothetical protein [Mycoplasmopsis opalescens]|uniref:hypothetical protein n=1 Tax=Mycoplasmopsis opalescens TaxID=114886 RepID=UPI0004A730A0|nr:hypothetical protein [Mycoplasmopsis opalescens]